MSAAEPTTRSEPNFVELALDAGQLQLVAYAREQDMGLGRRNLVFVDGDRHPHEVHDDGLEWEPVYRPKGADPMSEPRDVNAPLAGQMTVRELRAHLDLADPNALVGIVLPDQSLAPIRVVDIALPRVLLWPYGSTPSTRTPISPLMSPSERER